MPTDPGRHLPALARAAAKRRRTTKELLRWSAALAEAPWSSELPAAWEQEFRRAYAEELVARGLAQPAAKSGRSGAGQRSSLPRYQVGQSEAEHAEQAEIAATAGLSWSEWARRTLAAAALRAKSG